MPAKRGFVLLTVLFVLLGVSALAATVSLIARRDVLTTLNQTSAVRSYWAAEECGALLWDRIREALQSAPVDSRDPQRAWRTLDVRVDAINRVGAVANCSAYLESNGSRFDINRATSAEFHRFLVTHEVLGARADSLVDAILDWRDQDDEPRPFGAERSSYQARRAAEPRNGSFGNERELERVLGFAALPEAQRQAIIANAAVDADLVDLWHAPREVLRALPGFSPGVADAVIEARGHGPGVIGMPQLLNLLPAFARDSVAANYAALIARVDMQPTHWLVIATGSAGAPRVTTRMELWLSFAGNRTSLTRRRSWID